MTVVSRKGSMISAKHGNKVVTRNSNFFKKSPRHSTPAEEGDVSPDTGLVEPDAGSQTDTPNAQHAHNSPIHYPQDMQTPVNPRRSTSEKKLPCKLKIRPRVIISFDCSFCQIMLLQTPVLQIEAHSFIQGHLNCMLTHLPCLMNRTSLKE